MSMTYRYINVTGTHTFNLDLGKAVVRLGSITSGLVEMAELGQPGTGGVDLDDPGGAFNILGLQYFQAVEDAVADPDNQIVFYGLIGKRTITRGDSARASLRTGTDRLWSLDITDFNALLTMRMLTTSGADRPAETGGARLTWLLTLANCPFHDYGLVTYPTHAMDAAPYAGQTFADVLGDISAQITRNFFVYWSKVDSGIGLAFFDQDGTTYSSTAKISNVLADRVAGSVFEPVEGTLSLARDPSRIASGVWVAYNGGAPVYRTRSTTSDLYAVFDHAAPMANVKSSTAATAVGDKFLDASDTESDRITLSIRVPAANVNDIRAGHRLQVKFSHLPGYSSSSYVWCRVMTRGVMQDEESDQFYTIRLELTPQEPFSGEGWQPFDAPVLCTTVGGIDYYKTPSGYYPPMGTETSDATGNVVYAKTGTAIPNVPTPGFSGSWYFFSGHSTVYSGGAVAAGFVDFPCADSSNIARLLVVGPGTMTVHLRDQGGNNRVCGWMLNSYDPAGPTTTGIGSGTINVPADTVIVVPDDGHCFHFVDIGGALAYSQPPQNWIGFGGFDWVKA